MGYSSQGAKRGIIPVLVTYSTILPLEVKSVSKMTCPTGTTYAPGESTNEDYFR